MKITALDNVTCADLGIDPHEDAHQTGDIGVDLQEHFDHHSAAMMLSEEDWHAIHDALHKAWRRGIAFALSGRVEPVAQALVEDEANYYRDPRQAYSHYREDPRNE